MADKVLVAYGSRYGATKEIAEKIGDVIRQAGFDVDVKTGNESGNPQDYNAFILGSAVYAGFWRKDIVQFIQQNAGLLANHPTWIFSSGPTGGDPVQKTLDSWPYPPKLKSAIKQIQPKEVTMFHGSIDSSDLNPFFKLIIKMVKAPYGDYRRWDDIEAWAIGVAGQLKK